jgi:hypothetical protein
MARQFGLAPEQVQRAVAALLPAFALGLQRQAMNPTAMTQLFQTMMTGHYANFFESATQAFTAEGRREGQAIVDRLFGSDEVTRQVARQAAQVSGVGTEVLNQLLPLVAAILAGGMFKVMKSQGAMFGSMMSAWQNPAQAQGGNPWAALWDQWASAARAGEVPKSGSDQGGPAAANPFEAMMASFLGPAAEPRAEEKPAARPASDEAAASPIEAWGQMIEKGQEMQRQHLESLQAIFDSAWGRGDKP